MKQLLLTSVFGLCITQASADRGVDRCGDAGGGLPAAGRPTGLLPRTRLP